MEASDTVGELIALQEIDREILRIEDQLERFDAEIEELEATVEALEARKQRATTQVEEAEERVRRFQRAVQAGRATLKRLETRAAAVSNMQQHFAVRSETETARRNLRTAEDDQLDAMQDVENGRASLAEAERELTAARERLEGRRAEIDAARATLERELAAHSSEKRSQEERLEASALRLYRSVRGGRSASALASLTPDGVCGQCFTAVPKQRQADIRAGRRLAVCEGCGVILYPAEDSGD